MDPNSMLSLTLDRVRARQRKKAHLQAWKNVKTITSSFEESERLREKLISNPIPVGQSDPAH